MAENAVGHGTDADEQRASAGGAEPTHEPRTQDTAGGGRRAGLGATTILGILLIAIPIIWAAAYLSQAGTAGLGGFAVLVGVVLLAALLAGVLLLLGLFRA